MRHQLTSAFADFKATLSREQIVNALKANREAHIATYAVACEAYAVDAAAALQDKLDRVQAGEIVSLTIDVLCPVEYASQYDDLIKTFSLVNDTEFELTMEQMRCILHDEWDWTHKFHTVNSSYTAGPRRR